MAIRTRGEGGCELGENVAIFRALYFGDLLCSIPAIRAVKQASPDSRITLIGLPWAASFAQRFHAYLDDFIAMPPVQGLHDDPAPPGEVDRALQQIRERSFDLIIQMHGDGRFSNALVRRMGARAIAGFHPADGVQQEAREVLIPYPGAGSEVERCLSLVESIGVHTARTELEFPLTGEDEADLELTLSRDGISLCDYVCVHPGARLPSRRWPIEWFAAVADDLASRGLHVVITGSQDEMPLADALEDEMTWPALNLAGQTSMGALGVLLSRARLLVSNDTGVSHLAAALRTPSVIIANGSDTARWAPANKFLHRTLAYQLECRPCSHVVCPIGHPCALAISPGMVSEQAEAILSLSERLPA